MAISSREERFASGVHTADWRVYTYGTVSWDLGAHLRYAGDASSCGMCPENLAGKQLTHTNGGHRAKRGGTPCPGRGRAPTADRGKPVGVRADAPDARNVGVRQCLFRL